MKSFTFAKETFSKLPFEQSALKVKFSFIISAKYEKIREKCVKILKRYFVCNQEGSKIIKAIFKFCKKI